MSQQSPSVTEEHPQGSKCLILKKQAASLDVQKTKDNLFICRVLLSVQLQQLTQCLDVPAGPSELPQETTVNPLPPSTFKHAAPIRISQAVTEISKEEIDIGGK